MSRSTPQKHRDVRPSMTDPAINNPHFYQHSSHPHGHDPSHVRTISHQLEQQQQQQQQQQSQQQQQQSQQLPYPATSDYESDTAHYMADHPAVMPDTLAERTNTELNLSVLRRYLPSITSILSIAANAVVYVFEPPAEWKQSNMEGTMFVCSQHKSPAEIGDAGCIFILNRKGLQNFILDLNNVTDFELSGDLLIFKLDYAANKVQLGNGEAVVPNVLGLWTYAEEKSDRQQNADLIAGMWSKARAARAKGTTSDPSTITGLADPTLADPALTSDYGV